MQEPLQQEILTRIDKLTEKLGVTAEYLWPHLVQYQIALGVSVLVGAVLLSVISFICFTQGNKQPLTKRNSGYGVVEEYGAVAVVLFVAGVITGVIGLILFVVSITVGIPALIAPEAAAFKSLLPV